MPLGSVSPDAELASPDSTGSQPHREPTMSFAWLVACTIIALTLGMASAHLPQRWKLLGMLMILTGILFGTAARWLAGQFSVTPAGWRGVATMVLLTLGCLGVSSYESYRLRREALRPRPNDLARLHQALRSPESPETVRKLLEESVEKDAASFHAYLTDRWPSPWNRYGPLFWGIELILGTLASLAAFSTKRQPGNSTYSRSVISPG